jgi:hypothetical protein
MANGFLIGESLLTRIKTSLDRQDGQAIRLGDAAIPTRLQQDGGRPGFQILLCKADQNLGYNTVAYDLPVYSDTSENVPEIVEGKTITAVNRLYDIAAGSWLYVAKAARHLADQGGTPWNIIAASSEYNGQYPDSPYSGYQCSTPTIGGHDLATLPGYDAEKKQALTHNNGCLVWIDLEDCPP